MAGISKEDRRGEIRSALGDWNEPWQSRIWEGGGTGEAMDLKSKGRMKFRAIMTGTD